MQEESQEEGENIIDLEQEDLKPKPTRTILQEEEQVPELPEDDYEPEYVEEA